MNPFSPTNLLKKSENDLINTFYLIQNQLEIKIEKNGATAKQLDVGRGDRGSGEKRITIQRPEWDLIPPIFDRDEFEESFELFTKDLTDTIENLVPGYDADTIGQMSVTYDGDFYRLNDFAEIVVSGKTAMISLAGQTEVMPAIRAACSKNNLPCSDKGETMTIKLPPMTTQIRKNKIKTANDTFKQFKSVKMDKFVDEETKKALEEYLEVYDDHFDTVEPTMIRNHLLQIKAYMIQYTRKELENMKKELARKEKAMMKKKL